MKIINVCGKYYWITPLGEKLYPEFAKNYGVSLNGDQNLESIWDN